MNDRVIDAVLIHAGQKKIDVVALEQAHRFEQSDFPDRTVNVSANGASIVDGKHSSNRVMHRFAKICDFIEYGRRMPK